jgi:type III secretion protein L
MLHLKQPGFKFIPDKKVIKASEYAQYMSGQEVIQSAQEEAKVILEKSKVVFEEERQKGYEEGLKQGKQQMAQHLMDYVSKTVEGYEQFEEKMLEIVMQALRHILGEMDNKDLVMAVIKRVISVVRSQKEITLRVAPTQKDYVQSQLAPILSEYPSVGFIDVVADQRLREGDCIAETQIGVVDARLEVQLEAIHKAFSRRVK